MDRVYIREDDEEHHTVTHTAKFWKNSFVIKVTEGGDKPQYGSRPICSILISYDNETLLEIGPIQNRREFHHISTLLVELYEMVQCGVVRVPGDRWDFAETRLGKFFAILSDQPIYLNNKAQPMLFDGVPWFEHNDMIVMVKRRFGTGGDRSTQSIVVLKDGTTVMELNTFPTPNELVPTTKDEVIELLTKPKVN